MRTRFGSLTLDDERRVLLRDGAEVHLSPKAYELLGVLVARRPRALSKNELRDHLWPRTFVADISLATVVAELRAALGDPGRRGLIRTVHGFGYAFDGEAVEERADQAAPAAPGEVERWLDWGGREFALRERDYVIGRSSGVDIRITDMSVSKRHARLTIAGGEAVIEDLDSKNGTRVRGVRIQAPTPLEDGDEIRVGFVPVVFRSLASPADTRTGDEPST